MRKAIIIISILIGCGLIALWLGWHSEPKIQPAPKTDPPSDSLNTFEGLWPKPDSSFQDIPKELREWYVAEWRGML